MTKENYRNHPRNLLSDIVSEYMNDETLSSEALVDDLRKEVHSWMMYHQEHYVKASEIYDKL